MSLNSRMVLLSIVLIFRLSLLYNQDFILNQDNSAEQSLRRIRADIDLSLLSNEQKAELLMQRLIGKEIAFEPWKVIWAKIGLLAPIGPVREFLIYLENLRAVINPNDNEDMRVFYPFAGVKNQQIDLVSILLSTGFKELTAVSADLLSYEDFQRLSKDSLRWLPGLRWEDVKFEELRDFTYRVKFLYKNIERTVNFHFNKDAKNFFPDELRGGYEAVYTSYTPLSLALSAKIKNDWIRYLDKKDGGFMLTDMAPLEIEIEADEIWNYFLELPIEDVIDTAVFRAREGHLFVLDNRP